MTDRSLRKEDRSKKGRPRGAPTVAFALRLRPEQKRDLEIMSGILEGTPPLNGLIQTAIAQYVAAKLKDTTFRRQYEARLNPRLKMLG